MSKTKAVEVPTLTIDTDKACEECGKEGVCPTGLCLTCSTDHVRNGYLSVPADDHFVGEFMRDDRIDAHAVELIRSFQELSFIEDERLVITYLWKRTGGKSGGREVLGKCVKPSGLLHYFANCDFVIWLAADHLYGLRGFNFRRLLYHELCHIGIDDNGQPCIVRHQFEGFVSEIERFGIYDDSVKPMAEAFQQHLFES